MIQLTCHESWHGRTGTMSSTSFLLAARREFGDVHVPMESNGEEKSDKSDSIVNRFYQKRSIKTSMVAWSPTHAQEQQHRFQPIRLRRYLYNRCDNTRYYRIAWMYNCCQKHATSAVKQLTFILHWHVDMQGFTSILGIIIRFSLESFNIQTRSSTKSIQPSKTTWLPGGFFRNHGWLQRLSFKGGRGSWFGDMGGSNYPWPLGDDHLGTWPT